MRNSVASIAVGVCLAACGSPQIDDPPAPPVPDPPMQQAARGRVLGTTVDMAGRPLSGVDVALCGSSCRRLVSDGTGFFAFSDVPAGSYSLRVERSGNAPTASGKVVIPLYGYDPVATPARTFPPIVLPTFDQVTPLSAGVQTVAIDPQLSLTLDAQSLSFPMGTAMPQLTGKRVPAGLYPDFCLPGADGRIVAEWAMAPFATTSTSPIEIRIADGLGLSPNTQVNFLTIDPDLGRPEQQAVGTVAADGKSITSKPMTGIRRLTWLIVSLPGSGA